MIMVRDLIVFGFGCQRRLSRSFAMDEGLKLKRRTVKGFQRNEFNVSGALRAGSLIRDEFTLRFSETITFPIRCPTQYCGNSLRITANPAVVQSCTTAAGLFASPFQVFAPPQGFAVPACPLANA